ncbi:MAG: hypothetical protein PVF49_05100 [Anaerolineales bacterium]|jgi:hypothetical protein
MNTRINLSYLSVGAVIILTGIKLFRTILGHEKHGFSFNPLAANIEAQDPDPYASQYNAFLAELEDLPDEYADFIDLDKPSTISIPAHTPIVGALQVRFASQLIVVTIGDHTEQRFTRQYAQAAKFILAILTDQYVFHIYDGRVDIYERGDFLSSDDLDRDFYVWSGRLLDQMLSEGN